MPNALNHFPRPSWILALFVSGLWAGQTKDMSHLSPGWDLRLIENKMSKSSFFNENMTERIKLIGDQCD